MLTYIWSTFEKRISCNIKTICFSVYLANLEGVGSEAEQVEELLRRIMAAAKALIPDVEDLQAEQLGDLIDQEMQQTTEAIEAAAKRIAVCQAFIMIAEQGSEKNTLPSLVLFSKLYTLKLLGLI